ncbi:MAG: ABC transporter ATP-binding protein [Planctomycetes bacterium]|nr:ABC transporter ATP-binding protein [Planctomycetota bacterium]
MTTATTAPGEPAAAPSPSTSRVMETRALSKRFGDFIALDALDIHLDRGQILGFIGPNGAGKTTTIKILVGLLRPSSGEAVICGADCRRDARRIKKLVGYMPDRFGSYDNMRVSEYLDFFGAAFGIPRRARANRIHEVLETTNAAYMRDRYVESLSHGMQQRVGIARTLLHDPEVLILDEPANGLDPEARVEMRQLLLRLAAIGKSLIVTSHILPELARICDQVAIITNGRLRAFGPLAEIMRRVSQERTIEIQLANREDLPRAARIVDAFHGDAGASVSDTELMVRFRSHKSEDELGDLLRDLVDQRVRVSQFRELQADLEDAFLSVTREDGDRARIDAGAGTKAAR